MGNYLLLESRPTNLRASSFRAAISVKPTLDNEGR